MRPLKRAILLVAALALAFFFAGCAMLYGFERSLLYDPQPRAVTAPESTMTLAVDGATLVVTTRPHDGSKAIVYFGGNAEDVSRSMPLFETLFPDRALYLLHYRGYGGSSGEPSERDNVADGLALVEQVRARHPDVALVGRSLGSGVAVQVASRVAVSRLVLVTPYDSIVAIAADRFSWLPVRWLMRDTYDSGAYAPRIATPTMIIAAQNDTVIPRESTDTLFARFAPGVASIARIDGVGHNDLDASPVYREAMRAALP